MKIARWTLVCIAILKLSGCASPHYTVNEPLERHDPAHGYRFGTARPEENSDELFIAVTFSGGGMRAAALAYGVLERLKAERIRWQGRHLRLLDEVDIINASDMSLGSRFEFTQDFFDLLCSDLDKLPVARAVAASSALPLVFGGRPDQPLLVRDAGLRPAKRRDLAAGARNERRSGRSLPRRGQR